MGIFSSSHDLVLHIFSCHAQAVPDLQEYGELKTSFIYPLSVDNKARYCEVHGCSLVVSGRQHVE